MRLDFSTISEPLQGCTMENLEQPREVRNVRKLAEDIRTTKILDTWREHAVQRKTIWKRIFSKVTCHRRLKRLRSFRRI